VNNKITAFILGFVLLGTVMFILVLIFARPGAIEAPIPDNVLSSDDLQKAQQLSNGLENYGNLPYEITGDQIGRSNPFEPY